eukprot:1154305-Pelagomonas_calceolata.AAC.15
MHPRTSSVQQPKVPCPPCPGGVRELCDVIILLALDKSVTCKTISHESLEPLYFECHDALYLAQDAEVISWDIQHLELFTEVIPAHTMGVVAIPETEGRGKESHLRQQKCRGKMLGIQLTLLQVRKANCNVRATEQESRRGHKHKGKDAKTAQALPGIIDIVTGPPYACPQINHACSTQGAASIVVVAHVADLQKQIHSGSMIYTSLK